MKHFPSLLALLLTTVAAPWCASAATLKGVSFYLPGQGQYWGYPTVEVNIRHNGDWINDANGLVNFNLLPGNNNFEFYVSGNGIVGPAALNFRLGSTCNDGISSAITSGAASFSAVGGSGYWPVSNSCGYTFSSNSNSLTWTDGTDTVVLTSLTYIDHLSSGRNLTSYAGPNPPNTFDQWPDHYGTFTLQLNGDDSANPVPEPSTFALGAIALLALRFRRR